MFHQCSRLTSTRLHCIANVCYLHGLLFMALMIHLYMYLFTLDKSRVCELHVFCSSLYTKDFPTADLMAFHFYDRDKN